MPTERPAILVTGATGQVGYELVRALAPLGRIIAPSRQELDLSDEGRTRAYMERARPRAVVNAGAYTAVDRAESDLAACRLMNAVAPAVLAAAACAVGALMIHYSTDYVFDGTSQRPYREDDATRPINVYGETKRDGENAVIASGAPCLVLRTSWVYGSRGANFLRTMMRLSRERDELRVVNDQFGAPTWSRTIAEATAALLRDPLRSEHGMASIHDARGIYHLTSAGETTWFEFASAILGASRKAGADRVARLVPIMTADFPTPARRPARSVLDNSLIASQFGITIPHWREQLALVLDDLRNASQL